MGIDSNWYGNEKLDEISGIVLDYANFLKENPQIKKRDYTINVIGYGGVGQPLVKILSEVALQKNSNIKRLNVWFRDKKNSHEEDLKGEIPDLKDSKLEKKFSNIVKFKPVRRLNDLEEIVKNAHENLDEADICIVTTNYSWIDELVYENSAKETVPKTIPSIIDQFGKKDLFNLVKTNVYDAPQDPKKLIPIIKQLQEKRIEIGKIITDVQNRVGNSFERIQMLRYNLIGVNELGKALRGYSGTLLNIVNDPDISTHALMKSSQVDWNKIWGPSDNDYGRTILNIRKLYRQITGKDDLDVDIKVPLPIGVHGEGITLEKEKILFGNKTWDEQFKEKSDELFDFLVKKIGYHGFNYLRRKGEIPRDTAEWLARYTLKSIILEDNESEHRGSVYLKDFEMSTGMVFKIIQGTITELDKNELYKKDRKTRKDFNQGIQIIYQLTKELKKKGFIEKYENKTRELDFSKQVKILEEPKKRFVDSIIDGVVSAIKPAVKEEKKEEDKVLFYVRNPDYRSLSLYDLNSPDMFKKEIVFPDANDKTGIVGIKTLPDKGVVLLEKQNNRKLTNTQELTYKLFSINYDTQELGEIKEFSSLKINDFDYLNNKLFYTTQKEHNVKVMDLETGITQTYKDPVIDKEFFLVKSLETPNGFGIFGLREDGVLYWSKDRFKYPVRMAKTNSFPLYMNVYKLNGKKLLIYSEDDYAKIIDVTDYEGNLAILKTKSGVMGIYSHNGKIETFGVNLNDELVKKSFKSYNSLVKGKALSEETIKLEEEENDILENRILSIDVTKNNVVIGGENGYIIYQREPFRFEGKSIEGPTGCQSIIQRT